MPLLLLLILSACVKPQSQSQLPEELDEKKYKTVQIGNQTWMAENLNYDVKGSQCYDNEPENCVKYGRLYSFEAAMQACPNGWHLPSNDEWGVLVDLAGGEDFAGKKLKAKSGWDNYRDEHKGKSGRDRIGAGTDDYGFSALPGGSGDGKSFKNSGKHGYWWTSTGYNDGDAFTRHMGYRHDVANYDIDLRNLLYSVRCIQN